MEKKAAKKFRTKKATQRSNDLIASSYAKASRDPKVECHTED